MERQPFFLPKAVQHYKMSVLPKLIYKVNATPKKYQQAYFYGVRQADNKDHMEK